MHIDTVKVTNPPPNTRLICLHPDISKHAFEAILLESAGRKGFRWKLFNVQGRRGAFIYAGWQPKSWRLKDDNPQA